MTTVAQIPLNSFRTQTFNAKRDRIPHTKGFSTFSNFMTHSSHEGFQKFNKDFYNEVIYFGESHDKTFHSLSKQTRYGVTTLSVCNLQITRISNFNLQPFVSRI